MLLSFVIREQSIFYNKKHLNKLQIFLTSHYSKFWRNVVAESIELNSYFKSEALFQITKKPQKDLVNNLPMSEAKNATFDLFAVYV